MFRLFFALVTVATLSGASAADNAHPRVAFETSAGRIVLELDRQAAPDTVANFIGYVEDGFYNGTMFHRVIPDFMVQGGGYRTDYREPPTRDPIRNEADNGLENARGSIAMARTSDPHSASSQFFINLVDNDFLNFRAPRGQGWGYAVFGKVVEGMDVVDAIAAVPTGPGGPFPTDVPRQPIVIENTQLITTSETD